MITGFNTDIEYNGVTYHVQTEDKGLDTPLILSLVYNRGTILASKRSPYNDLLLGNFDEKELAERLNRQHKLICAAIRAGRIDDLKRMNSKGAAAKDKTESKEQKKELTIKVNKVPPPEEKPVVKVEEKIESVEPKVEVISPPKIEEAPINLKVEETPVPNLLKEDPAKFAPIKKPEIDLPKPELNLKPQIRPIPEPKVEKKEEVWETPIEITDADLIFDDTQNLEEVIIIPDEAVEILTDFSEAQENKDEQLFIELLNEVTFKGGESKTVSIMVGRGTEKVALVSVNIMIKVLGSSFRPLIFHTKTDSNGVAIVNLQIPQFSRGRAAVLLKAMSNGEEAEIRRVIHPN